MKAFVFAHGLYMEAVPLSLEDLKDLTIEEQKQLQFAVNGLNKWLSEDPQRIELIRHKEVKKKTKPKQRGTMLIKDIKN